MARRFDSEMDQISVERDQALLEQELAQFVATVGNPQVAIQFKDEGSNLGTPGTATSLDFVGSGVSAARVGNAVTVTIAGGGGGPGSVASDAIFDAKGDLPVGTANDTAARLPVGTSGHFLAAKSDETTGLVWRAIAQADITGLVAALALLAPLASPALTGDPTTPNQSAASNNTRIANTAYVDAAVAALINSAPGALDTLDELAAAFGDDPNFATTVTNALALKAPLASPTFTGTVAGITKSMVGLANVDNTADTAKPVSTAQQTALDLKANLASPTLTGNPLAPTPAAGDNDTSIATTAFVQQAVPNASYRSLLDCTGSHVAARVAGTYWLGQGQPAGITGTGTLYAPNIIYIDSADYPTIDGKTPKLRIRAQVYVNDVAPTGNYTFGLYPVTRPATSGGAALNIYAMGTVIAGSTVAVNTPAADSMNILAGADFALPANGHYVVGFVSTTNVAASSHLHISAILQMRNA